MKEIIIDNRESGQRFDKYLKKYLSQAGSGFIYKMLRKKNITLNGRKASGKELLSEGDSVKMFFSDDTFEKFTAYVPERKNACSGQRNSLSVSKAPVGENKTAVTGMSVTGKNAVIHGTPVNDNNDVLTESRINRCNAAGKKTAGMELTIGNTNGKKIVICAGCRVEILYEDDNVIFMNKPAGLLSQGNGKGGVSLVDILSSYLAHTDERYGIPSGFRPGICNRLDRNTSGVVAAGKTVRGLQELSESIRTKTVRKIYACVVEGQVDESKRLKGYLTKDTSKNTVSLSDVKSEGASYVETIYRPVKTNGFVTLLEVELVTGKSHQIRAHMANEGHPVVGDVKYGSKIRTSCGHQLLHAHKMVFADTGRIPDAVAGLVVEAEIPAHYNKYFD